MTSVLPRFVLSWRGTGYLAPIDERIGHMSNDSAMEYAQGLADTLRSETVEDIGDYLEGVLDYQYTRDARGELVSVRLLVSFGGPNAWITYDGEGALVEASWYSDVQRVYVSDVELSGLVLDYFQDAVLVA